MTMTPRMKISALSQKRITSAVLYRNNYVAFTFDDGSKIEVRADDLFDEHGMTLVNDLDFQDRKEG